MLLQVTICSIIASGSGLGPLSVSNILVLRKPILQGRRGANAYELFDEWYHIAESGGRGSATGRPKDGWFDAVA